MRVPVACASPPRTSAKQSGQSGTDSSPFVLAAMPLSSGFSLAPWKRLPLDPLAPAQFLSLPPGVHVRWRHGAESLVVAPVVVVIEESCERPLQPPRHVVVLEPDHVLNGSMTPLDLPLGHRVVRRAAGVLHPSLGWNPAYLRRLLPGPECPVRPVHSSRAGRIGAGRFRRLQSSRRPTDQTPERRRFRSNDAP